MFDVKPVTPSGSLNLEKIRKLQKTVILKEKKYPTNTQFRKLRGLPLADVVKPKVAIKSSVNTLRQNIFDDIHKTQNLGSLQGNAKFQSKPENLDRYFREPAENYQPEIRGSSTSIMKVEPPSAVQKQKKRKKEKTKAIKAFAKKLVPNFSELRIERDVFSQYSVPKFRYAFSFASILILFSLLIPALSYFQKALNTRTLLLAKSNDALGRLAQAKDNLSNSNFEKAALDFSESRQILSDASQEIEKMGGNFSEILRFVPGISKLASANYMISAGEHFSIAGKNIAESVESLNSLENPLDFNNQANQPSLTDLFLNLQDGLQKSQEEISQAENDLNKVNIDDLPAEIRDKFLEIKSKLPIVNASIENFLDYSQIFLDILGYNGPRKYLFLFQNNQEMRATGGFIGSYGILDISNGRVKKLFVDNIYNPDGQLKARVIPPAPIQKMSAVWTMHDANWFPNFPTSAEKVSWFYEKTGGPTVDGVIAITPELLCDLLEITGPIEMPEYDVTIDAENFIEKTQKEVELDYDKEENQPKKIIADLTPKILDRVFSERELASIVKILKTLDSALAQKHLLLYSKNYNIQKLISEQRWSGEILNSNKDYLSVINTNINGYKTDGVIDETIHHQSEIQSNGTVVDTAAITRKHNGGNEEYDWWNKVNGDWMRVYVPKGAKLLAVSGHTREFVAPALDYQSLGFKRDPQLESVDDTARIDEESGTKIYEENNKTVFANWVYVSPGESVTITYKYVLPFKLSFDALHHPADSFSVLYQKQSGSIGSKLVSEIKLPENMRSIWHWPDNLRQSENSYKMETVLTTDKFVGIAMENAK